MLFSTPMVQALIDGRKTVTRRILKVKGCKPFVPDNNWSLEEIMRWNKDYHPYGQKGDLIWVRETWAPALSDYAYKADYSNATLNEPRNKGLWKPSIHMPKAACRIWLLNEGVTVERLQDITRQDCINEGIAYVQTNHEKWGNIPGSYFDYERETYAPLPSGKISPSMSFMSLWRSINGAESWEANPWVWVVRLKVVSTTGRDAVKL